MEWSRNNLSVSICSGGYYGYRHAKEACTCPAFYLCLDHGPSPFTVSELYQFTLIEVPKADTDRLMNISYVSLRSS